MISRAKRLNAAGSTIVLSVVILAAVIGAGTVVYMRVRSSTNPKPTPGAEAEYRGYKQGRCPDGKYQAWSGGAPTGDDTKDTICLDKSGVDKREELYKNGGTLKPAIFLYADKDTNFTITPTFSIVDPFIYPAFNNNASSWKGTVLAGENGDISLNGGDYDYLFWEGYTEKVYEYTKGNVVSKAQTIEFLEENLRKQGLNAREAGDFITFWGPRLVQNDYNLIMFANDEYTAAHPLEVSPQPDYSLRVFMVYKPVGKDYQVPTQTFVDAQPRHGFSLIEWGGKEQNN